jgi:ankyrin repeat protein
MHKLVIYIFLFFAFAGSLFPEPTQELLEAVRNNDFARSESLIKGGAELNGQDQAIENSPLFWAIDNENINLVMLLLAGGADFKRQVDSPYFGKMSIAEYAMKHGSHKIAGIFAEVSGRLALNKKLITAIEADDLAAVGQLLEMGAEVNSEFEFHHPLLWTPGKITVFEYAIALDREKIVELFIKNDINKNIEYAEYALQFAIAGKSLRMLELLLQNGGYRKIPLDVAAIVGNTEVIGFLLKNKADPDVFYLNGHSAADIALKNGHREAALLLLLAETTLSAGLKDMYRAIYNNDLAKIQQLVAGGFDLNQGWYTPLAWAAFLGKTELVNLFIEQGALVHDEEKRSDDSPVFLAALNGNIDIVRILLKKGALVDACDEYGWTMLHQAVKNGDVEMVDLLLKEKAELGFAVNGVYSHQDCPVGTPVHVAAALDRIQVLKIFLKNGLAIDYRKGKEGSPEHLTADTPLHYAAR